MYERVDRGKRPHPTRILRTYNAHALYLPTLPSAKLTAAKAASQHNKYGQCELRRQGCPLASRKRLYAQHVLDSLPRHNTAPLRRYSSCASTPYNVLTRSSTLTADAFQAPGQSTRRQHCKFPGTAMKTSRLVLYVSKQQQTTAGGGYSGSRPCQRLSDWTSNRRWLYIQT